MGRRGTLMAAVAVAVLLVGSIGYALFGRALGPSARSVPQVSRPTVVTPSQRLTPVVYPTREAYVPPVPIAEPTPRQPSPTATTPTPSPQRPPCPSRWPHSHDWCIRHGFAPPSG